MNLEYTFDTYERILEKLASNRYTSTDFISEVPSDGLLLRHDVDLSLANAVRVAELEAGLGFESTFFVSISGPFYDLTNGRSNDILMEIQDLGHSVGLHFNTHQYFDSEPDSSKFEDLVDREWSALNELLTGISKVVSFHAPPDWLLATTVEGYASAYEPRYFSEVTYRSDSSHRWHELPAFLDDPPRPLHLLTHPGLWDDTHTPFSELVGAYYEKRVREFREQIKAEYGVSLEEYGRCEK